MGSNPAFICNRKERKDLVLQSNTRPSARTIFDGTKDVQEFMEDMSLMSPEEAT
jgi:hypothetical protein